MSIRNWGKLVRDLNGCNVDTNIPEIILLYDIEQFIGRLPNADATKFRHSQQIVIPSLFISSTHFSIEMKRSSEEAQKIAYYLTDHSRNGTFYRRKQVAPNSRPNSVEAMGLSKRVQIYDGDEIIFKFQNEIKLVYVFTKTTYPSVEEDDAILNHAAISESEVRPVDIAPSSSSRKRAKVATIGNEGTKGTVTEGRRITPEMGEVQNSGSLKQQILSLQQENRAQERRLASIVADNGALSATLSTTVRELRNAQATVTLKNSEISSLTSSLKETEANSAATEARLRNLEDVAEVTTSSTSFCY